MGLQHLLCLLVTLGAVAAAPITKERLRFKLSARGLPDKDNIGTIDPYVEVYYTEGGVGSTKETKLGVTDAISDNENPDWGKVFEFDFDRSKNQQFHFLIWDKDHAREDDKGGQVWVDVNDYVDKGQLINSNLDKQGFLTVKSADPTPQQQSLSTPGTLPYAPGSPETGTLTFKISANGLKDKDNFGKTDPYAEIFYTNGLTGKPTKIGRTNTLSNTKNPQWGESFTLAWDRKKEQRILVKIYDNDNFREDDKAGLAWLEVNDYVAKGQMMTVRLNKKGTMTIARADGLPPNPYNPALAIASQQQPGARISGEYPVTPTQYVPGPPSSQFPQSPQQQFPQQPSPHLAPGQVPQPQFNQQPSAQQFPASPINTQQRGPQQPQPAIPQSPVKVQPVAARTQYPIKMRIKLSASNLADKDLIGTSDPYVKVYITQDGVPETLIKTGTVLNDNENPQWEDIYEFDYDPAKHQKLRFLVLDQDDNLRDDNLGEAFLDTSELELRNYVILRLTSGSLTVMKV